VSRHPLRKIARRVHKWSIIGSLLFLCDPEYFDRLWTCVVRHAITFEEIVKLAEEAGERADRGFHG